MLLAVMRLPEPGLCEGIAKGAYPELLVVEPAPIPELIGSEDLRLVVGHGVEDVEERVRLELTEVARLQSCGAMPVAVRYLRRNQCRRFQAGRSRIVDLAHSSSGQTSHVVQHQ